MWIRKNPAGQPNLLFSNPGMIMDDNNEPVKRYGFPADDNDIAACKALLDSYVPRAPHNRTTPTRITRGDLMLPEVRGY